MTTAATITAFVPTDPALFRTPLEVIRQRTTGTNSRGLPVLATNPDGTPDYTVDAAISAHVECLSGRKLEIARQLVPTATHLVVTRFYSVITPRKKLRLTTSYGVKIFCVNYLQDMDERNQELRITCTEEIPPDAG